jgi:hypothetical protein
VCGTVIYRSSVVNQISIARSASKWLLSQPTEAAELPPVGRNQVGATAATWHELAVVADDGSESLPIQLQLKAKKRATKL